MNSNLKFKLLQNLSAKRANGGFTLIELLVVVIIVGILAAVALPNLIGQIGKAREVEGKNGVGSINRAAQAFHFEAQTFVPLAGVDPATANNALGVVVVSQYYDFDDSTVTGVENAFSIAVDPTNGTVDGVRSYGGGVVFDTANAVYDTAVCQTIDVAASGVAATVTNLADATCPTATTTELD